MSEKQLPPCSGQSEEQIKDWMKEHVAIGEIVAVRNSHAGFIQYAQAKVVRIGKGRFEVDSLGEGNLSQSGTAFYYSGKNCWHPKGKTRLVIPTEPVLAACGKLSPLATYDYSGFTV